MKRFFLPLLAALFLLSARSDAQQSFEIWFDAGSVRYHGLLLASPSNPNWWLRVKYYDSECPCTRLIEQKMSVEKTMMGFRLNGSDVRDVKKNKYVSDYSADNFYIYNTADGNFQIKNIDDQGVVANARIFLVDGASILQKLKEFNW